LLVVVVAVVVVVVAVAVAAVVPGEVVVAAFVLAHLPRSGNHLVTDDKETPLLHLEVS
jgi:hypothetical protein